MNLLGNTLSYEWFRTKTRFDTEANVNSEMAVVFYLNSLNITQYAHQMTCFTGIVIHSWIFWMLEGFSILTFH